jgi:hypothetical protein
MKLATLTPLLLIVGCATTPRHDAIQLRSMSDSQICITAQQTNKGHPDFDTVSAIYIERVSNGRFTVAQCREHFNNFVMEKAKADGAAFGRAIGGILGTAAAGYAANPRAAPAPVYSAQPTQGLLRLLESESVSGANRYCRYSDGIIVTVSSLTFCPNSIRR